MVQNISTIYKFGSVQYDLHARTYIMGVLNVTPDSFSDGGKHLNVETALKRGLEIVEAGADFIDVGGESTRPGADVVPLNEEINRVIPVIEKLAKTSQVPISIDTYKSEVAERALDVGAVIVNDISGLLYDQRMADVVSKNKASIILMHINGKPRTMQIDPRYENLIEEICDYLKESIRIAQVAKIDQIIVDPGIGFGKTVEHNLEIIKKMKEFSRFGFPVLVGPSRKSFIGKILNLPVDERLEGTAAAVAVSAVNGANIVRVHDVKQMKKVIQVVDAIQRA